MATWVEFFALVDQPEIETKVLEFEPRQFLQACHEGMAELMMGRPGAGKFWGFTSYEDLWHLGVCSNQEPVSVVQVSHPPGDILVMGDGRCPPGYALITLVSVRDLLVGTEAESKLLQLLKEIEQCPRK